MREISFDRLYKVLVCMNIFIQFFTIKKIRFWGTFLRENTILKEQRVVKIQI